MTMDSLRIDDVARELFERLPEAARTMRRDIESNFRAVLQSSLGRLDLTTRDQFDVQTKVLERTRERLEQLELRVAALEKRLQEQQEAVPPIIE
jgi:BMFP domain-containing protein YqiC